MPKYVQRVITGYSAMAIGSAIVSVPLAFLDVYFLRIPVAYIMGDSENSMLAWVAAVALAIVALSLAALAGRFFEGHERFSKPVVAVLATIWFLLAHFSLASE